MQEAGGDAMGLSRLIAQQRQCCCTTEQDQSSG
jgi:hypothetical protein